MAGITWLLCQRSGFKLSSSNKSLMGKLNIRFSVRFLFWSFEHWKMEVDRLWQGFKSFISLKAVCPYLCLCLSRFIFQHWTIERTIFGSVLFCSVRCRVVFWNISSVKLISCYLNQVKMIFDTKGFTEFLMTKEQCYQSALKNAWLQTLLLQCPRTRRTFSFDFALRRCSLRGFPFRRQRLACN